MRIALLFTATILSGFLGKAGAQNIYTLDNATNVYSDGNLFKSIVSPGSNPVMDMNLNVYHDGTVTNMDGTLRFVIYKNGKYLRDGTYTGASFADTSGNFFSGSYNTQKKMFFVYKDGVIFKQFKGSAYEKFGVTDAAGNIYTSVYNAGANTIKVRINGMDFKNFILPANTPALQIGAVYDNGSTIYFYFNNNLSLTTTIYRNTSLFKTVRWKSNSEKFGTIF
ncbi:MAG: hypothetical protein ACHQEB_04845 [Chitinophagales bacterium]